MDNPNALLSLDHAIKIPCADDTTNGSGRIVPYAAELLWWRAFPRLAAPALEGMIAAPPLDPESA
jgi:hypothetical protein